MGRDGGIKGREGMKENIKEERVKESTERKIRLSLGSKGEEVIHGRTLKHKNTIRDRWGTRKRRFMFGEGGPYYEVAGLCPIVSSKFNWSLRSGALLCAWHKGEKEARYYDIRGAAWMCEVLRIFSLMSKKGLFMKFSSILKRLPWRNSLSPEVGNNPLPKRIQDHKVCWEKALRLS